MPQHSTWTSCTVRAAPAGWSWSPRSTTPPSCTASSRTSLPGARDDH